MSLRVTNQPWCTIDRLQNSGVGMPGCAEPTSTSSSEVLGPGLRRGTSPFVLAIGTYRSILHDFELLWSRKIS